MSFYTIETTYRMPYYQHRNVDADTVEEACRRAVEDGDWFGELPDYENPGQTYVTAIWHGENAAYAGHAVTVPDQFDDTIQRKAEMLDTLLMLIREPAQTMGLSRDDFERWLPRALADIERAEAIVSDRAVQPRSR
ncbi:hypothetical protein [Rhizobium leguminosarum]|uniref:hypothetical protein n=1 Tax=Rhizobium leguminosarum TaxID=384 RepID=UPI001AE8F47B|nr:hypothetical protein [Rhizobium leguminosarum]MBP2449815.1 hypothetical protein [Rhizobium leguminosarum]